MKNLKPVLLLILILICNSLSYSQWTNVINFPALFVPDMVRCGNKIFAGTSTGILNAGQIYVSSDQGQSWSLVNTGFNISGVFSMASRDNFIYVGTYQDGLLMSTDAGNTWTLNDMGVWRLGVFGVGVSGDNNVIAYINHGTGQNLSTDKGFSWSPLSILGSINQLQTFIDLPGKFLAGGRNGVAVSANNGSNWTAQSNNGVVANPDGTKPMRAIYYFNDKIFAGCMNKIYSSADFGNNFIATNILLNNFEYISSFASSGNKLYASVNTASGSSTPAVIMTTNDGADWLSYQGNGFPGKGLSSIIVSDDYLIAGTKQNGIWIRPLEKCDLNLTISFEGFSLTDTITAELRNSVSPYNIIESRKATGGQTVPHLIGFTNAVNGTPYYIVVKHRNSIRTWSSSPQTFNNNTLSYDFTTGSSQAFGSNMVFANTAWSFYTGDVNQDGIVDLTDGSQIYNDGLNFTSGYVSTDLNYDGIADLGDLILQFNNGKKYVSEMKP